MSRPALSTDIEIHIRNLEQLRGWYIEALEIGAAMVDAGAGLRDGSDPFAVLRGIGPRLRTLFNFNAFVFLRIDDGDNQFRFYDCHPEARREWIEREIDHQIERGTFAWTLTQTRPVIGRARDGQHTLVMQVIATRARIRGMFIGFMEQNSGELRDSMLQVLAMILSNAANAIENYELYRYIHAQNQDLERIVEERTADLQVARIEAEAANEAKSSFLANMSHEIRSPLTSIIGFSELLRDESLPAGERRQAVETIYNTGRHLLEIINDILDLSRLSADRLQIEIIRSPLAELINRVAALIGMQAQQKGLRFRVECAGPLPRDIDTDPTRLLQILLNLCTNAVKFTAHGSVVLTLSCVPERRELIFDIEDTGIGLTREQIDRLFQAFTQADASTTRKFGGTGLGLHISRLLAEQLGGTIRVESRPGIGSRFTVTIGCGEVDPDSLTADLLTEAVVAPCAGHAGKDTPRLHGHVLLAEDDPDIRRLIVLYLGGAGLRVTEVDNGRSAVEAALAGDFDLLLTDLQMPEMGGLEAVEWLRAAGFGRPIIALSAGALSGEAERCLAAGCNEFLTKPIDRTALTGLLGKYLPADAGADPSPALDQDPAYQAARAGFLASIAAAWPEWQAWREAPDWQRMRAMAHRLKGTAGGFGYERLGQCAGRLEHAIIENRRADANVACAELLREMAGLLPAATMTTSNRTRDHERRTGHDHR